MFTRFRHKLLAAFCALIVTIILPILFFVNSAIDRVSEARIEAGLRGAWAVLQELLETRRRMLADSAGVLISSQPSLRALLGSADNDEADLFGGGGEEARADPEELNHALFSTVESLDVYQRSGVFALADAGGRLLFSKVARGARDVDLREIPIIREALMGKQTHSIWGCRQRDLQRLGLVACGDAPELYEVFVKPVAFGGRVAGLLVVGFAVTLADAVHLREVTQSEIALFAGGEPYIASASVPDGLVARAGAESVREIASDAMPGLVRSAFRGEEFIGLVASLRDSLGEPVARPILFRSKNREIAPFRHLKTVVNTVGILAVLFAVFISIGISGRVTGAVNELARGVEAVGAGRLDTVVEVSSRDEFSRLAGAFNQMTEGLRQREALKQVFRRYVNPRVVNALIESGRPLGLGGERRRLVLYFADIAGFTSLAETQTPETTVRLLNEYLSGAAAILEGAGAIVDKFVGDAIFAYWMVGTGEQTPEELACRAALEHRRLAQTLGDRWRAEGIAGAFGIRIGIHGGEAIVGNIGSDTRMDFTVIGDDVNTASRLESVNKFYGTGILVSDAVTAAAGRFHAFREIDRVRLAGKERAITLYELLGELGSLDEDGRKRMRRYGEALALYRARRFDEANRLFRSLAEGEGGDPTAAHLASRAARYAADPPAESWEGVYELNRK